MSRPGQLYAPAAARVFKPRRAGAMPRAPDTDRVFLSPREHPYARSPPSLRAPRELLPPWPLMAPAFLPRGGASDAPSDDLVALCGLLDRQEAKNIDQQVRCGQAAGAIGGVPTRQ